MKRTTTILFFSKLLSPQITSHLTQRPHGVVKIFLTGEALTALWDQDQMPIWRSIFERDPEEMRVVIDKKELGLMGLAEEHLNQTYSLSSEEVVDITDHFWESLLDLVLKDQPQDKTGFFQLYGPYMDRTTVYMLRYLETALNRNVKARLFNYLDGIHNGHAHQRPSEFLNIGQKLIELQKYPEFKILTCSRCATARGYWYQNKKGDITEYDTIPGFGICNLNKLIDQFEFGYPIIASNWIAQIEAPEPMQETHKMATQEEKSKTPLLIFITQPPYSQEQPFGALSFAVAAANHEIETKVIFIGRGVFCLQGAHQVEENERLFNLQDIILGTMDMEFLEYSVLQPSLSQFNISLQGELEEIPQINPEELDKLTTDEKIRRSGMKYQGYFF